MIFGLNIRKNVLIPSAVFAGIFLVSFIIFLADGFFKEKQLVFFPEHAGGKVSGEARTIVKQPEVEEDIELLVGEIILGPMDIRHAGVLPRNTKVRSVIVRGGTAYLDLTVDALFPGEEVKMTFDESLAAVKKTILFNFRRLEQVVVTVDGQVPGEASYLPREAVKKGGEEKQVKNR